MIFKLMSVLRHMSTASCRISSSSNIQPSWGKNTLGRILSVMKRSHPSTLTDNVDSDLDVTSEFDRDVSEAMVTLGGRVMGLDPHDLMHSKGLCKLVARNIRWFQNTPDWLKLVGLVVAKRLNSAVRSTIGHSDANGSSHCGDMNRIEGLDYGIKQDEPIELVQQSVAEPSLPVVESVEKIDVEKTDPPSDNPDAVPSPVSVLIDSPIKHIKHKKPSLKIPKATDMDLDTSLF